MTQAPPKTPARRLRLAFAAIPLLALLSLFAWAFASPIGAGPDDDFHLSSIWCGGTASPELCGETGSDDTRLLSVDVFAMSSCYGLDSQESASCQGRDFGEDLTQERRETARGNFTGLYPPVYYSAMSVFAGDNLEVSALTMRAVNAALFVGMVTALFFLLPVRRRVTLLLGVVVTAVPLGMFLIPSNNPSGWAILSACTLWIALLGYFETTGRRRIGLAVVATVATVVGAGARADSAIYAGVAIVVVALLTAERGRGYLLRSLFPAALMLIAVVLFFSANQSLAASTGLSGGDDLPELSAFALIVYNFLQLPSLWTGPFGTWPLGWLDTPLPAMVPFLSVGAVGGALLLGTRDRYRRKGVAAALIAALVVLLPLYLLYQSGALVGLQVQPRYILPLIILLVGIWLLASGAGRGPVGTRTQALIMAAALAGANAVALHFNIRRYVTGIDAFGANLDNGAEWWWNIPLSAMGVWAIGTLAFAGLVFWLAAIWAPRRVPTAPAPIGATVGT